MDKKKELPMWEVFIRPQSGLDHRHCGSLHAADNKMAIKYARDLFSRRNEAESIWVCKSENIFASNPNKKGSYFEVSEDKQFRDPQFYKIPKDVDYM